VRYHKVAKFMFVVFLLVQKDLYSGITLTSWGWHICCGNCVRCGWRKCKRMSCQQDGNTTATVN